MDTKNIDQAVAQWESSLAATQNSLELLKSFVGGFTSLTELMMDTLVRLTRRHRVDCKTMKRADDPYTVPDISFCACGADELNMYMQNMAWQIVNEWRKLKGEGALEWEHKRLWTNYFKKET